MGKRKIVSLFSGAMGLDLGLEGPTGGLDGPLETIVCADSEKSCRETISQNRPGIQVFDDVREVGKDSVDGEICVVSGGPPCQSWSTAGRRKGFGDPRGSLILEFGRVVREISPRFFVMENVRGLLSMATDDGKMAINVLIDEFRKIGYKTVHGILDAVNFGVPQFRERLVVIGSRDDEDIFLPYPTHFPQHQNLLSRWNVLEDALLRVHEEHEYLEFSKKRKKWMKKIPEGGNWKSLSDKDQRAAMGDAFFSDGGKTGFFRRLSREEPCPTLVTSPAQKSTTLCHPTETRPLSVQEYFEAQTFPDFWKLAGSTREKYKQLGNAVPSKLGEAIGNMLMSVMDGSHTVKAARMDAGKKRRKVKTVTDDEGPKILWGDDE
jgi:DNA (cytosine-5)-methyltransferase 1